MQLGLKRCNNAYKSVMWLTSLADRWKNGEAARDISREGRLSEGRNWSPIDRRCARLILFRVHDRREETRKEISWETFYPHATSQPQLLSKFFVCILPNKFKEPSQYTSIACLRFSRVSPLFTDSLTKLKQTFYCQKYQNIDSFKTVISGKSLKNFQIISLNIEKFILYIISHRVPFFKILYL